METIIKGNETYYDLEIRFGEIGAIMQSKDDNKHPAIGFSKQQALQLAAALTDRYGGDEWKPVKDIDRHIVDRTPLWVEFEDETCEIEHAVYANSRFYDMWGNAITGRISRYQVIPKAIK